MSTSSTPAIPDPVIHPAELAHRIQSLRPQRVHEIGTATWITAHQTVLQLLQQATLEMRSHQEEAVTELLVEHAKLPVLVHELIAVQLWRTRVLPRLLAIEPQPTASFGLYTVLFHEATVLSLIECALFHPDGCRALNETSLDLIDYCANALAQLCGLCGERERNEDAGRSEVEAAGNAASDAAAELQRQQHDIAFKIGMRCVSTLCYLIDRLDVLGLSAIARLVRTHDTPVLLSQVLHAAPWRRRRADGTVEKFADDRWRAVRGDAAMRLTNIEAQTWLCLRQLLVNPTAMRSYAITEFRQRELARCQGLMHEVLLDQLPPLAEFKHYLVTLQVKASSSSSSGESKVGPLLLEELPMVRERLVAGVKSDGGWRHVVELQARVFLHKSAEEVQQMARQLNDTYGAEVWERMEGQENGNGGGEGADAGEKHECTLCGQPSLKKCYRCKRTYYCGRECQVKDWPRHKVEDCGDAMKSQCG